MISEVRESRLRGRGLAFEELRQYAQGDDVRTIDWKATARLRKPHVRVYAEERERPVLLVVDQRSPMFFGSRRAMKSVTAAEVAALGAWRTLQSGDRPGAVIFNEAEIVELRPHRSQTGVLRLLHEIAAKNQQLASDSPPSGGIGLNDALHAAARLARHDHLVILVSDLDGADDETRRLATKLVAHNDVLVVATYDPLGATLQGRPGMHASDRGTTWELPDTPAFAERFRHCFEELLSHWVDTFRALRVPVLPMSTAEPVATQLRRLFGQQRHP